MIAATRDPEWEERMWALTHDLVVAASVTAGMDRAAPRECVADCIVIASTTVSTYRAVLERLSEDLS